MDFDENIRQLAGKRLEQLRQDHHRDIERLRMEVHAREPRIPALDREIQATMPKLLALAFGKDPDRTEKIRRLQEENQNLQAQQAALLASLGLAPDALEDRPYCPDCRDTGWRNGTMCHCLRDLCLEEQTRSLSRLLDLNDQSFETFNLDYYTDSSSRNVASQNFIICRSYAEKFDTISSRNLLLSGSPGLGKTFLSACIAREVSAKGYSVVYESAPAVFNDFEQRKFRSHTDEGGESRDAVHRYLKCDLLILDDLGSEMNTQVVISALYELINTRLVDRLHTVISTNLEPKDLAPRYTPKVASRLIGEYLSLHFFGQDIRQLKKSTNRGKL